MKANSKTIKDTEKESRESMEEFERGCGKMTNSLNGSTMIGWKRLALIT